MKSKLLVLLMLFSFLGFSQSREYVVEKVKTDTRDYRQGVKVDGGTIPLTRYEKAYRAMAIRNGIWDNIKFAWVAGAGVRQATPLYIDKLYDIFDSGDAVQSTSGLQPFYGNKGSVIYTSGGSMTIPSVTVNGTVTKVYKWGDSITIEQSTINTTITSVTWKGSLYAYIVRNEVLTDGEKAIEEVMLNEMYGSVGYTSETDWYGIEYDITATSPTVTRIGSNMALHASLPVHNLLKACLLKDDLSVNYYLDPTDWSKKLDGSVSDLSGADGQVMIRKTAKTYWKFEEAGNIRRVKVSLYPQSGFTESDIWNIGAYEAALQRSTLKLSSVVNVTTDYRGGNNTSAWDALSKTLLGKPATNISRTNFRTYARNRGTGWNQLTYNTYKELVWLFVIEYATFNSQLAVNAALTAEGYKQGGLGDGVTTANGTEWNTFNGYNPFILCGASNSLASGTGSVNVSITDFGGTGVTRTFAVNRYRGVENPFGHIWKWIDGINFYANECFVFDNYANIADGTSTNARSIGFKPASDGWIKTMIAGEIMPSVVGGGADNTTYMCDYYWQPNNTTTWYALLVGGSAGSGATAGLLVAITSYGAADTYTFIGARLHASLP